MRLDDNDNTFIISSLMNISEEFAKAEAIRYQNKGHHQTYWAEKMGSKHKNGQIPVI